MRTITARREIDQLFSSGRRVGHPALVVFARPTAPPTRVEGGVVFVAGKRLGGAVVRNRAKRVLRAALQRGGGPWSGWDLALVASPLTATASAEDLDEALRAAIDSLGIER